MIRDPDIRLHLMLLPTHRKPHKPSSLLSSFGTILIHLYTCTHRQNSKCSCITTRKHTIWGLLQLAQSLTRETVAREGKGRGKMHLSCTASKFIMTAWTLPLIPNSNLFTLRIKILQRFRSYIYKSVNKSTQKKS